MKLPKSPKEYSLEDAVWCFATSEMRRNFNQSNEGYGDFKVSDSEDQAEQLGNLFAGVQGTLEQLSRRAEIWSQMGEHLFALIRAGKLVATGVRTKPTVGAERERVAAHLFDGPITKCRAGAVENFGRRFEAIRILRPDANAPAGRRPLDSRGR
jgi:hypothetical protein